MIHDSRKRLGQHFLVSRTVLADILAAADIQPDDVTLEIGPGTGTLTFELAKRAERVIAVEKDPRLAGELRGELARRGIQNVEVIEDDILKLFPDHLPIPTSHLAPHTSQYRVVANIPYYLTSRLIRRLLESDRRPQDILLTVQKEVAERIVARPPRMNLLALAVQAYGTPEIIARIPASAFSPRPKVDSALIRISNISTEFFDAAAAAPERFFAMIRRAFSQRRKTLTNSLVPVFGGKAAVREALKTIGRAETARPQELLPEEWLELLKALG